MLQKIKTSNLGLINKRFLIGLELFIKMETRYVQTVDKRINLVKHTN
jgi:hypothetical protein